MTITLPDNSTYTVIPSDSSARHTELTGDERVELKFESAEYVEIPPGSSVTFLGATYWVERPQDVTIHHSRSYEYTCKFWSPAARWRHLPYINPDDGRVEFPVTGTAYTHLNMLVRGANGVYNVPWTIGNTGGDLVNIKATGEKVISYSSQTLWEALETIASEFGLEFEFNAYAVYLHKVEYNRSSPLTLSYGRDNGLLPGIHRRNYGDNPPLLAIAVKGGTRNINTSSGQSAYGAKSLHMPASIRSQGGVDVPLVVGFDGSKFAYADEYNDTITGTPGYSYVEETGFDATTAKYYMIDLGGRIMRYAGTDGSFPTLPAAMMGPGTRMEVMDCTDIYPTVTHTITAVSSQSVSEQGSDGQTETFLEYSVEVSTTTDYNAIRIPGQTMSVIFQSGNLAGKEFGVVFDLDGSTGTFTIESQFIDDERMPGGSFVPQTGNTFKVYGCMLPDDYIRKDSDHTGAEWDMARAAAKHLWKYGEVHYSWEADLSGIFVSGLSDADYAKIRIGGYVSFFDTQVQAAPLLIRITALKQPLNHPKWIEVTLEDYSTLRLRRRMAMAEASAARVDNSRVHNDLHAFNHEISIRPTYTRMDEYVAVEADARKIFYGQTTTASSSAAKVVTLIEPANVAFRNGSLIRVRFGNDVAASPSGTTITVSGETYALAYNGALLTAAGVIKAGDYVTAYCYNSYAWIQSIDRWGNDIALKQDLLVSGQNIRMLNGLDLLGSGNLSVEPKYTHYEHLISENGETVEINCPENERTHHHIRISPLVTVSPRLEIELDNTSENIITIDEHGGRVVTELPITISVGGEPCGKVSRSDFSNAGILIPQGMSFLYIYTKGLSTRVTLKAIPGEDPYVESTGMWMDFIDVTE